MEKSDDRQKQVQEVDKSPREKTQGNKQRTMKHTDK